MLSRSQLFLLDVGPSRLYWYIVNTMWSIYITQELKCDNWTHPVVWLSLFSCTQCVELLDNVVQPCYYIVTDQLLLEQVIDTTLATTRFVCLSAFSITVVSLVLRPDFWYTCHIWVLCSLIMYSAVQPCYYGETNLLHFVQAIACHNTLCLFECFLDHCFFSCTKTWLLIYMYIFGCCAR